MSAHLRKLCDYLAYDFANSGQNQNINKRVDAVNDLIWKYNIVTLDRLVLCLAIRTQEGNEAQVCFYIIQLLLLKSPEFRSRVLEFVKNHPDHWYYSVHIVDNTYMNKHYIIFNHKGNKAIGMKNTSHSINCSVRNFRRMNPSHTPNYQFILVTCVYVFCRCWIL